jgi:hypothetical protein
MKIRNTHTQTVTLIGKGDVVDGVPPTICIGPGEAVDADLVDMVHLAFDILLGLDVLVIEDAPPAPPKKKSR